MSANTAPIFTLVPDIAWGAADGNGGTLKGSRSRLSASSVSTSWPSGKGGRTWDRGGSNGKW